MLQPKIISITTEIDEVQLWNEGQMLGAGAWTKPYDLDIAVKAILDACMGRYSMA